MSTFWNGCNHPPREADQNDLERNASSKAHKVLAALWDGRWHKTDELIAVAGHRFGAAVRVLRKSGWDIDTKRFVSLSGRDFFQYRLVSRVPGPDESSQVRIYVNPHDAEQAAAGFLTVGMVEAAKEALS